MKPYQPFFLPAKCLTLNDEIICFTASPNLNVKQCREYMRKSGQKVETTGSKRFDITMWKNVGSDRTSWYIDGPIHSVFAESSTLSHFYDSDAQIQTVFYYITEVYRLFTLLGSLRYLITLLNYNLFHYIVELNTNKITLLSYTKS